MKLKTYAILFVFLQIVPIVFARERYLQVLDNSHIKEVIVDYRVHNGVALKLNRQGRRLHNVRHAWMLEKQCLIQRSSRISIRKEAESSIKSKPSQFVHDYGKISFFDSTNANDQTIIETQMNRIESGNWIPPLPETSHTSSEVVCPLLGCFVAGNPYMQRYEGEYVIRALGEEVFKGVRCKKYSYMITGPFSTYFKDKGVLAEGEETALLKLQQDLTISGTLFVDVVTGIICARAEKIQFSVVEAKRLNLTSEWITTREHIRIARERSWIIESVTTVYR